VQIKQKMADEPIYPLGKKWLMLVTPDMTGPVGVFTGLISNAKNSIGKKWLMLIVDNDTDYTQKLTLSKSGFYNAIAIYLLECEMKSKLVSLSLRKLNISVALLSLADSND
jgi:hypothetical protein